MTPPTDAAATYDRRWAVLWVMNLSLVLVVAANSSLNVALPTIVRELDATSSQLQWMVDAYALVFAGLLLPIGALGDRFGRKGMLQRASSSSPSARCWPCSPPSRGTLIATRSIMGVGAAMIMPATLSIITNVFPPQERSKAIAIWAGFAGAGAAVGPAAQRLPARALLVRLGLPGERPDLRRGPGRRRCCSCPPPGIPASASSTPSAACCRWSACSPCSTPSSRAPTRAGPTRSP